jgi:alkanesulfonate monooxygenase SsuD/methylene tetrahydromethanopterin reductase-like flavin-dependent oxidoreductase (luciferase family)
MASFLLGRTRRLRVGTAVTLVPLYHPVQLAEQAALLDQLSGGRFDFGIGRGGYLREFEVFGVELARWDREVEETIGVVTRAWTQDEGPTGASLKLCPRPLTQPHPPLYVGSATPGSVERAARLGLPLLHYFGAPLEARIPVETRYRAAAEAAGRDPAAIDHVHAFVAHVCDDEKKARHRLRESLVQLFRDGNHPTVPQAANRHVGADGKPLDRDGLAAFVAEHALVGSPAQLCGELARLIEEHGIRRFVLFMEPIGDGDTLYESVERFAKEVAVHFASTGDTERRT